MNDMTQPSPETPATPCAGATGSVGHCCGGFTGARGEPGEPGVPLVLSTDELRPHAPPANTGPPLFPAAPPASSPPAAPSWLAKVWEKAGTVPWGKTVFAVVFIVVATFYFKDQRVAEEKAKQAPPAAPADPPVPPNWDQMPDEELAKLGFRKVTQDDLDKEIVPGVVVVSRGAQGTPGYRVVGVEGDYIFAEDLGDPGRYTALLLISVERKKP